MREKVNEPHMKSHLDEWDEVLERASGDSWWMPARVVRVVRPEISYTYDPEGVSLYCTVQRIDQHLSDYRDLIEEVIEAHRPSGSCDITVAAPSASSLLTQALEQRGFQTIDVADAWTIDVNAPRPDLPRDLEVMRVETLEAMQDMDRVMDACFERYQPRGTEALQADLKATQGAESRCLRFVAYDLNDYTPLATAALNLFAEQRVGFMWGGSTVPEARGRGVYSALITHRMQVARALNLERIGLYALRGTSGPIIERQGFDRHGPVEFWSLKCEDPA